ncbi:MAG: DNA polymerase III subunit delta' [Syntrophales bacterium]|nr:DNA polymerase III subunit delta' [Syntrophales bacterium]
MSFKDIYGHDKQIGILQAAVARSRVPHAYLFYGMKGIGKRTTAVVFAKALNCREGGDVFDACDKCSSCRKTDHRNHPDVTIIEAEGQFIRIREIRDIQNQMKFKPFEGGKRIFIIVDADKMNITSANALLKTLEEPSPSNILILITSRPYQLPLTVLSRCQHLRFNPLLKETIHSFLQDRLVMDSESAMVLASSSGGSIGKALEMSKDAFLTLRNEVLSKISENRMKDPPNILSFASNFGKDRREIIDRLDILRICYRDALVYKETAEMERLINQDHTDIIKSIADRLSGQDIMNNIKTVDWASDAIDRNANKALTLEAMMFKIIW